MTEKALFEPETPLPELLDSIRTQAIGVDAASDEALQCARIFGLWNTEYLKIQQFELEKDSARFDQDMKIQKHDLDVVTMNFDQMMKAAELASKRAEEHSFRRFLKPDLIVPAATSLIAVFATLFREEGHAVASKAFAFIPKMHF